MDWSMFIGALLVYAGGVITALPHRFAALVRQEALLWRRRAKDDRFGDFRIVMEKIADDLEGEAGPKKSQWYLMLVGVTVGLVRALLMSA